jgi:hypothetical protein
MKDAEGDGGLSDKSGGRKRNHLSYTSSPGEMPNNSRSIDSPIIIGP